ncbi:DUF3369 domain-containing protein [Hwanghaeella grinnelliae]|uniref:DUF3369 domain-containing protein n=1 Tax=Hwanghaeella grinnelliae TaxID=2500179 RepID=A0A437QXH1_9PROT|nr:DUF3369 domain-containing protein [Hwanghaeella grinnelliae]RVU39212.1 DUF3369 domain-containing protein [Hwanghaeella grinnelliae]
MTDTLIFASPIMRTGPEKPASDPWKILVVDDEPDIHAITKIALSDFELDDRRISQLHAYSAKEARSILEENPDIAMLLLDVVMESDGAGLDLVHYIRNVIGNTTMRIVLRTGNPGHAPERRVIAEYDINDYREKSELTTQKLNTVMYTALRSYRDILATEKDKEKLEKLVDTTANLFTKRTPGELAAYAIAQACTLLDPASRQGEQQEKSTENAFMAIVGEDQRISILAASGSFGSLESDTTIDDLPDDLSEDIQVSLAQDRLYHSEGRLVVRMQASENRNYLICIEGVGELRDMDKRLLDMLMRNSVMAFDTMEKANLPPSADIVRIH